MYNTLNKQTSFFVALSLTLILFYTCKKDDGECNIANVPTVEWQKTIGGNDTTAINSVQQTTDGGYILAGYKVNSPNGNDYWIAKLNSNANIEWEKTYGGSGQDGAKTIQQTTDGGYIVVGHTKSVNGDISNNHGSTDIWLLKLNSNGSLNWQKTYGGSDYEYTNCIKQTNDGGFIVSAQAASNDGDVSNNKSHNGYWLIKLDINGNLKWSKTFEGINLERTNNVQQTTDGGYLIVGGSQTINSYNAGTRSNIDYWVVKLQANGNLNWQKTYGGSGNDQANCIQKTNDGHYIIAGYTFSSDGDITRLDGGSDAWVLKIDDLGNILQQTTIGTNDHETAYNISQTHNNNLLIAGSSQNNNGGEERIFIAALNTNFTLLWQQQIPQENNSSSAKAIFETPDCGYMLFGNQILENNLRNTFIIKLK
jgi:hypothetical protein